MTAAADAGAGAMPRADLQQRWLDLFSHVEPNEVVSDAFDDLAARYGEAHRAYHNLVHIEHMFVEFDGAVDCAEDARAVELAIWFHDVIYDTFAKDSEEKSALYAAAMLDEFGFSEEAILSVSALIIATKHDVVPSDPDQCLIVDIDLSILGQDPERFEAYEREIREEYSWVPDAEFRSGRLGVLRMFADRPNIFATAFFRDKYEEAARLNLQRSIDALA